MTDYAGARRTMVDCQLRTFDVSDRAVLAAMESVPRERFVPAGREALAYLDQNLTISAVGDDDEARVMLAPMVLARLVQALDIEPDARVLDVAGAYGYSSALLARLGARVTLLESRDDLAADAVLRLSSAGLDDRVVCRTGPIAEGSATDAPFDAILVNGAVDEVPQTLLDQLADGGRLACLKMAGRSGKAVLHVRSGPAFGFRTLFDASAPVLSAFRAVPAFSF